MCVYRFMFGNSLDVPRTLGLRLAPNVKIRDFTGINRRFFLVIYNTFVKKYNHDYIV